MKIKRFNEHNNIEIQGGGLKCDNPHCDFEDETIPIEDYEKWINKPCPKCGENLLTQEDYDQTMQILDAMSIINSYSPEDLDTIAGNLSPEEIDQALDKLNQLKIRKEGDDTWIINPRKG
jgi:hypothetical protein